MRDTGKKYLGIVAHYEDCLARHGDSHLGVDWPRKEDADTRYRVMLDVIRPRPDSPVTLLDFGCGASHLLEYIRRHNIPNINYSGLDISEKFIDLARQKFAQVDYYCADILETPERVPVFDYVIMNGVFTERRDLNYAEMWDYLTSMLAVVFEKARKGIAFNVMSKHVDWERDDLFHVPFDELTDFISAHLSRHFLIRHDYGLYEYTAYVYREAT